MPESAANPWSVTVLTLFPEMFPGPLGASLPGKALESGLWALETVDIRDFAGNKHRTVDDAPFGGGPGMVMRPDVLARAIDATATGGEDEALIHLSPRGAPLNQARVRDLCALRRLVLVCGRFEGVDERVIQARGLEEVSIGDYILSGGEPAAVVLIDACVRLLPGVVGAPDGLADESFETGLLEYPHYTRPNPWDGREVPDVLLSGHHERVRQWRHEQAERITRKRRPDLWRRYRRARTVDDE
ncbi:MAG: tRNA (guanosine(37)-N1)-methyltransferase TrmD [Rhodospirillales bacterium]|nr:tRNA (guanosine(37)-N1)-methyltransferase TrmD [Rhodospirillales bacterium]